MTLLKQNCLQLSMVQLSGALSFPVIMVGYYIGYHYTLMKSIILIILGNFILFILSIIYMRLINQYKLVTIEFAQHTLGEMGATLCSIGMLFSLVGWSVIQIGMVRTAIPHSNISGVFIAVSIYFLCINGLRNLVYANQLLLPILMGCLIYIAISLSSSHSTITTSIEPSLKIGFLMIITVAAGLVFDLPTFYRHAHSYNQATLSLTIIFIFILPTAEGLGLYLARFTSILSEKGDWLQDFLNHCNIATLITLIISSTLSCCINLYSATTIIDHLFKIKYSSSLPMLCCIASTFSFFNLSNHLSTAMEIINLNIEIVFVMILSYTLFHKAECFPPTPQQQQVHLYIFFFILTYLFCALLFNIRLFDDLFLDIAFLTFSIMAGFYFIKNFLGENR